MNKAESNHYHSKYYQPRATGQDDSQLHDTIQAMAHESDKQLGLSDERDAAAPDTTPALGQFVNAMLELFNKLEIWLETHWPTLKTE